MTIVIGIDPHKASHTATAIGPGSVEAATIRLRATRTTPEESLSWAAQWPERRWGIEGARGLGQLLAQQLVAAGEHVVDVPATLSARVRILDTGHGRKTDRIDAAAVALVATGSTTVTHTVAGADYGANNVTAPDVAVTVTPRAVVVAPTSLITVGLNPVSEGPHRGAILAARFSTAFAATAVPTDGVSDECTTVTSTSKVDNRGTPNDDTDDRLKIELEVATAVAREDCRYEIRLGLPLALIVHENGWGGGLVVCGVFGRGVGCWWGV